MNWKIYSLISALSSAITVGTSKYLSNRIPITNLLFIWFFFESFIFFMLSDKTAYNNIKKNDWWFIVGTVICFMISNICDQTAIKLSPNPAYHQAIRVSNIILIAIASMIIFKSEFELKSFIGILLVILGVLIISKII